MNEKFTPGPWHVEIGDDEDNDGVIYVCHPATNCPETTICTFLDSDDEQDITNANLIAAAPEMYDVITALLEYIDAIPEDVAASLPTMPGVSRDYVESVMAKARGES